MCVYAMPSKSRVRSVGLSIPSIDPLQRDEGHAAVVAAWRVAQIKQSDVEAKQERTGRHELSLLMHLLVAHRAGCMTISIIYSALSTNAEPFPRSQYRPGVLAHP